MKVEREIAGFALPFAAGVLLASLQDIVPYHILSAVTMVLCTCAAGFGTQIRAHKIPAFAGWTVLIILALCCGIFCFSNAFLIETGSVGTLFGLTGSFAERCCAIVQNRIDNIAFRQEETSAIIKALLTGEKADIHPDIRAAFRKSGASHILALSGMHLGIIYGMVHKGLSVLGNRPAAKLTRTLLLCTACCFYTLAVGAGESIVRAFIFILINESAGLALRYKSLKHTLLLALVIQLVISPLSISSVSFQLSYAAMAGIAFIHPRLKNFWPDKEGRPGTRGIFAKLWDSASLSISCQITTAPIAWHYFRTFPAYFILTNLIAIPLTCLIIPSAILCTALHSAGICLTVKKGCIQHFHILLII